MMSRVEMRLGAEDVRLERKERSPKYVYLSTERCDDDSEAFTTAVSVSKRISWLAG